MKKEILSGLEDPGQLEKLYRANRSLFKQEFSLLYPELSNNAVAKCWNERLNYQSPEKAEHVYSRDIIFIVIAAILAGLTAKLPAILNIDPENFYSRNIGFIVFPFLAAYFAWRNKLSATRIAIMGAIAVAGLIFINFLPDPKTSNTTVLSCIHLVLVLWALSGFAFAGEQYKNSGDRLAYLKYNGDLLVASGLIIIAGAILTAITIGLFSVIGINIEKFYFDNVVIFALPAVPIAATYLTRTNPQLVGKISPVIAKLFSPLVLIMLVIYLTAILYSGKDPYNDREFLLIFNALLLGVMAIIFFSVAGTFGSEKSRAETWILLLLSAITVIVNSIALTAILFRISADGITPNRLAVLGGNILILINLVLVTVQLFRVVFKKAGISRVGNTIALYLPVYIAWAVIVTFLFPVFFGFR